MFLVIGDGMVVRGGFIKLADRDGNFSLGVWVRCTKKE